MSTKIITLDGPAASGKSSVSREIARRHGWTWVSTGAFFRGLAQVALLEKIDFKDEFTLSVLAREPLWSVEMDLERTQVFYNHKDITNDIYSEKTGQAASVISQFPLVRQALLRAQRDCQKGLEVLIAEGRDCGTVIFPEALIKIYLTANAQDRAQRRSIEHGLQFEKVEREQKKRDSQDTNREIAPLQVPTDAVVIDSSSMTLNQVIEAVDQVICARVHL